MKKLLTLIFAAVVAFPVMAATTPRSGSFLSTAITSGSDTNLSVTNALYVPANLTTNLSSRCYSAVNVSGAATMALVVDLVSAVAAGETNNGFMTLVFGASVDGATYTTDTNSVAVTVPVAGTRRVTWSTNITADAVGPFAYVRLQSIGHTNLGAYYVTNVQYRFLQTLY